METYKSIFIKGLAFYCVIWTMFLFTGCKTTEVEQNLSGPVFIPPPPEVARLQFLTSFSGPKDFGARITNSLERFVLEDTEVMKGISMPYGMALFDGKLYVCDVGRKMIAVFDFRNHTFSYMTKDRRLIKPVNIFIDEDGFKYVADPTAGRVFVFNRDDKLINILGQQLRISPIDVVVRGDLCYVSDYTSNQVVVLTKITGQEIMRVGLRRSTKLRIQPEPKVPPGEIYLISDLALDQHGNIYTTDKAGGRITQFNRYGIFKRTIGRLGDNIDEFVRPKGIAIDRDNRIWVVDASTEVAKIYNEQGQLLLFFGLPGNRPGMLNLPATIILDYDNVELFQKYAVQGAKIEFLVLVSNQYGPNKISIYGFGTFPVYGKMNE